ncbi:MAG TPA: MarR family transcriptional regulator [Gaiellaceae bacterium]|nr:MarR family transcriptional regulator [Gaiellaceae bacterium]
MVRNRSTVKITPGLFLQPYILDQLVGGLMQRIVGPSAVTGSEFAVTSCIDSTGPTTPTELGHLLGVSLTTLSATIDRLVKKGLLRRVRHPDDGRSYLVELTDAGNAANHDCFGRFKVEMEAVRANLEGDADEILAGMRVLEAALRKTLES